MAYEQSLVDFIDTVSDLVVEDIQNMMAALVDALGDSPVGYVAGDRIAQLHRYIGTFDPQTQAWVPGLRDDFQQREAFITEIAQRENLTRNDAEVAAVREFMRLEKMLINAGGVRGVVTALLLREAPGAARSARKAQATLDAPPFTLNPPLEPVNPFAMLAGTDMPQGTDMGMGGVGATEGV